jgi:two-component sensor histidine kinase
LINTGESSRVEREGAAWHRGWLSTPRAFILATAALVGVFGLGSWSLFLWADYQREVRAAEAYAEGVLDALGEHIRRLVATNDLLLQQAVRMLDEDGVELYREDRAEWLKLATLAALPHQTSILTVTDENGSIQITSRGFGKETPVLSVADREYFEAHQSGAVNGLLIGPTVFSRIDERPYLIFSRRWEGEGGTFLGVVTSAVQAEAFIEFAERLVYGPRSAMSVIRDDGLVLIRRPLTPEVTQLRLNQYELFTEHLARAPAGRYYAISPADGERRLVHYRRLEDLPLVLVTGLAIDEILSDWRRHAWQTGLMVLAGMIALLTLAAYGSRRAAREQAALRELAASREQERLLMAEVDHRSKNLLALVQSLLRQTARTAPDKEALETALAGRLQALATAHELPGGDQESADLRTLVEREVRPFAQPGRIQLDGEPLPIPAQMAVTLGMVVHELATNAAKHGALSAEEGRVEIAWQVREGHSPSLWLDWVESGGPPVRRPESKGFGMTLLERSVGFELGGTIELDFAPAGVRAQLSLPLEASEGGLSQSAAAATPPGDATASSPSHRIA